MPYTTPEICVANVVSVQDFTDLTRIDRIEQLVGHLQVFVLPLMLTDDDLLVAVRLMMCSQVRCANLPHWPIHLSRNFMNWVSHKTMYIGLALIGAERRALIGMGAPASDIMTEKTRLLIASVCEQAKSQQRF